MSKGNYIPSNRSAQFSTVNPLARLPRCVQLLALVAGLFCAQGLHAQAPAVLWTTNVGARHLCGVDQFTNIYVSTGGTIIQLNSSGIPQQTNVINQGASLAQRGADGSFYFTGVRPAFNSGFSYQYGSTNACFLAKYTSSGVLVWSNGFGPSNSLKGITMTDLRVETNGDAYVGYSYYVSTQNPICSAARFDNGGSNVWTVAMPQQSGVIFTTEGVTRFGKLSPTNGYVITYVAYNNSFLNIVSKFDSNGTGTVMTNWTSVEGAVWVPGDGPTPPLIQDASDNFYTAEGQLFKRGPQGNVIWDEDPMGGSFPVGPDVFGGVHVGDFSSHLLRFDSAGNWVWTINLPGNCFEMLLDGSGNRFVSCANNSIVRLGPESITGPSITNISQSLTTFVGSNVTFTVGAAGFTPFHYYWFFNNSPLAAPDSSSLALSAVTANQSGSYSVIVSNSVNSVTSSPVQLTVKQVAVFVGSQMLTNGTYNFPTNPVIAIRSAFTNGAIYYSLDGSTPSVSSTLYSGSFILYSNATIRAIGYSADFSQSEEADTVNGVILAHHSLAASTAGGGSITLNPPGGDYLTSVTVAATAVPDPGWSFLYWTGDASGTDPALNIPMHSDQSIHAVFGTTLSTTVQGNGQVLLYPSSDLYSYGQTVRLIGAPQSGSHFGAWGNAASGNANPLYFKITNANPTVSSIFITNTAGQSTLTVLTSGRGSVSASPQGNVYSTGQSVTLTATADPGQTFVNWTGDASGTQNPLTVILNQDKTVTANFTGGPLFRVSSDFGEGMHSDGFRFSFLSDANTVYDILWSTNFTTWQSFAHITNQSGEVQLVDPSAIGQPHKYYRHSP